MKNTKYLSTNDLTATLTIPDLTDPQNGKHGLQDLVVEIHHALSEAWSCSRMVYRSSPVVTIQDNYDDLGYQREGVARDSRYTRYITPNLLLRTQTSASIPRILRSIALDPPQDLLIACPGLVYRRDVIDKLHVGEPHQLDLWRICQRPMSKVDLQEMIAIIMATVIPDNEYRVIDSPHSYTQEGVQIDVKSRENWIEVGECGIASRTLLARSGLPGSVHGLAMGLGLDRLLMIRKNMSDIRLIRSENPKIKSQMLDLQEYRPVSNQPQIVRDLSLCIDGLITDEEIGDKVRDHLGDEVSWLEELEVRNRTPYANLPESAQMRMGMKPNQDNILLRVVVRHLTKTLTSEEANHLRDKIYILLHEGDHNELAT